MNNYEYIIASLPVLSLDLKDSGGICFEDTVGQIRGMCSRKDRELIDSLTGGFDESALDEAFYRNVLASGNGFIREYFSLDLRLRNAKVRYLNRQLDRPGDTDIFMEAEADADPDEEARIGELFNTGDILRRERNVDDYMWESIDRINLFSYFSIDAILGFIAKLRIIDRWVRLDEAAGREMFRKLVAEVKGTFKGVEY